MDRDDLNDVQHLTARVAALEKLVTLLLAANVRLEQDPVAALREELRNIRASAQNVHRPIDPASDAIWNEMFLTIERLYGNASARFSEDPPSA